MADIGDAGEGLHRLHGLALRLQIHQLDGVAVLQNLRVQVLEQLLIRVLGLEVLHGLIPGNEGDGGHIGNGLQPGLEGPGLGLGVAVIHIGQDLILLFQGGQQLIGVYRHQGKGTHNQQAGHRDADGGKGHEAVAEHIAQSLVEKIAEIVTFSHGYAPPHSRPRCR